MSKFIHGKDFLGDLIDRGIIPDSAFRVVIEANLHDAVRLYVARYGEEDLLKVVKGHSGFYVHICGAEGPEVPLLSEPEEEGA